MPETETAESPPPVLTGADLSLVQDWVDIEQKLLQAALAAPVGSRVRKSLARAVAAMPNTCLIDIGPPPEQLGEMISGVLAQINARIALGRNGLRQARNWTEIAADALDEATRCAAPPLPSSVHPPLPPRQAHGGSAESQSLQLSELGAEP